MPNLILKNKPLILIGDIHGDLSFLKDFIEKFPGLNILQVGDFGIGFYHPLKENSRMKKIELALEQADSELFVIRGNHDNPKYFTNKTWVNRLTFLGDYEILELNGKRIQVVGGGISIDRLIRTKGKSWWEGEKVVFQPDKIEKVDCFISHVPPKNFILDKFQTNGFVEEFCKTDSTLREELKEEQVQIQELFDRSGAKQCYFGHMHVSVQCTDELDRNYRCLDINESLELKY